MRNESSPTQGDGDVNEALSPPPMGNPLPGLRARPGAAAPRPGRTPVDCGNLPFLIRRDGTWIYRGTPIGRKELVCLFASVLNRDADGVFWLETPAERGRIEVEDAPFVAVELDWTGSGRDQALSFRTNIDQVVTAGAKHPIRIAHDILTCEPTPYIKLRPGKGTFQVEARIGRAVYYELMALAVPHFVSGRRMLGVWSGGMFFPLGELPRKRRLSATTVDDAELRRRLAACVPGNAEIGRIVHGAELIGIYERAPAPAAVLVGFVTGAAPGVLLTKRNEQLRRHAGQVSFPGGRIDPDDADATDAALREAREEIALDPRRVEVLGPVGDFLTGTGFRITPVVGLIPSGLPLVPEPKSKSRRCSTLPLDVLLDPRRTAPGTPGAERHHSRRLGLAASRTLYLGCHGGDPGACCGDAASELVGCACSG